MFEEFVNEKLTKVAESLVDNKTSPLNTKVDEIVQSLEITTDVIDLLNQKIVEVDSTMLKKDDIDKLKPKDGKNGKDGKKGDRGDRGDNGIDGLDGENGSPDTPKDIVNKLESLSGEARLDKKAIKGLDKVIGQEDLDRAISILDSRTSFLINQVSSNTNTGGGGGAFSSITGTPTEVAYFDALGQGTSDSQATRNSVTLETIFGRTTTLSVSPVEFDGSGADDLSVDISGFNGDNSVAYTVTIKSGDPTTPNVITWADNRGNQGPLLGVPIVAGVPITLSFGVEITFASATGHDDDDVWAFDVFASMNTQFVENDDVFGFGFGGAGNKMTAESGAFAFDGVVNNPYGPAVAQVYADDSFFQVNIMQPGVMVRRINDTMLNNGIEENFSANGWQLRVNDGSSTTELSFDAQVGLTINNNYSLPLDEGSVGEVIIADGAGGTYWGSAGGGAISIDSNSTLFSVNSSYVPSTSTNSIAFGNGAETQDQESIAIGTGSGLQEANANNSAYSIAFGYTAGRDTLTGIGATFLGRNAGGRNNVASYAVVGGTFAGIGLRTAGGYSSITNAVIFGNNAGDRNSGSVSGGAGLSSYLDSSVILGYGAFIDNGNTLVNANAQAAVVIGAYAAGAVNTNVSDWDISSSVILGPSAGFNANLARNSIFIGQAAGYNDTVDNTGDAYDYSILLGQYTSTGGFSNSIAIGGSATNTATNQLMIGSSTRPINEVTVVGSTTRYTEITKKVSLTSAEILALNGTPKELVASPGSGYFVQVISVTARLNFVSTPYTTNLSLYVYDDIAGGILFRDGTAIVPGILLPATTTTMGQLIPFSQSNDPANSISANSGVYLSTYTNNPLAGNGTLDVYITYKVIAQ